MEIHALTEQLALNPMDPKDLLSAFGVPGVLAILFAETGLLVGFFFPGDSLLFLAGVAASSVADSIFDTKLSIAALLIGAPICAIIGAQLGHWLGAKYGRRMFDKPESKLFKKEYVEKAEYYFEKFGPAKAVVLARFIPIVRTFLNPVAGTLGMPAKQFFLWNVVGAILWTDGIILIGYLLAQRIYDAIGDQIDHYILPVVALIIVISVLPIFIEILRERKHKKVGKSDGPEPVEAFGVVAAASVAGIADAAHDEIHPHHQPVAAPHGGQTQQGYGQPPHQYGQAPHAPAQYGPDRYDEPTGQYGGQLFPPQPQNQGQQPGQAYGQPSGHVYGQPAQQPPQYGDDQNWPR
ncbi:DedA family protein [Actinoplanes sp. DH11]|uniref:DedA family protein n=1 Tax=Actinoplanes sp. DH11 TaxID=2857011 RepID=UPI0027DF3433|nr:DedA family protein [Actinoplanes sp. DH11]